jgi:hypothetical protein
MEYTKEIIEELAKENVVDIEVGIDYSNRIRLTLENGYTITADIYNIQSREERLAEIENKIAKMQEEILKLENAKTFVLSIVPEPSATETL